MINCLSTMCHSVDFTKDLHNSYWFAEAYTG